MKYIWTSMVVVLLSGVIDCFLTNIAASSSESGWDPWGKWICDVTQNDDCLLLRRRVCLSSNACVGSSATQIVWNETAHDCPCATDASVDVSQDGQGYWNEWGTWSCVTQDGYNIKFRNRNCSVPRDDTNCPEEQRYDIFDTTTCTGADVPQWTAWGQLHCRTVNGQCYGFKYRTCSSGYIEDCKRYSPEVESELVDCPSEKCQIPVWSEWGPYTCKTNTNSSCVMERTRTCSSNDTSACTQLVGFEKITENCTTDICPPHWLKWGDWKCVISGGKCVRARTRNCSTGNSSHCIGENYEFKICDGTICAAHWTAWSIWKCSMEDRGVCIMGRNRQCSTGNTTDCNGDKTSEVTLCQEKFCPDLYHLQQSRVCSNYTMNLPCIDKAGCSTNTQTSIFLCRTIEGASFCPKVCGCCENEVNETPHWTDWVDTCSLRPPGGRCVVTRTRQCELSTGPATGCNGTNIEETNCTDTLCGELNLIQSDCSRHDSTKQCTETIGCSEIFDKNEIGPVCTSGGHLCPILCGCCEVTSNTTVAPTSQTTLFTPSPPTTLISLTTAPPSTTTTTEQPTTTSIESTTTTLPMTTTTSEPSTTTTTVPFTTSVESTTTETSPTTTTVSFTSTTEAFTSTTAETTTTPLLVTSTSTDHSTISSTANISVQTPTMKSTIPAIVTATSPHMTAQQNFTMATQVSAGTGQVTATTSQLPTIPPIPTICAQCSGPPDLCEFLYEEKPCDPPNNYCINKLINSVDGDRVVQRGCGNIDTCYNDWFLGTSDKDKCRTYDQNNLVTLNFKCTFCCITDSCNVPIRPADKTLYTKN